MKEIHGCNPELGLSVFTEQALNRLEQKVTPELAAIRPINDTKKAVATATKRKQKVPAIK